MRIASLYSYPIKGFAPNPHRSLRLEPGRGLPLDRALAFTSGNRPDEPRPGGWVPSRTFLQLTVYPQLAAWRIRLDEARGVVTVIAPDGDSADIVIDHPQGARDANRLLRRHFPGGDFGPPSIHAQLPRHGFWDFTDSTVSLINLATIEAIADHLDPLRFRGNIYLEDMESYAEFALTGRLISIGEATLEVIRPIMRCAATCANPSTGEADINVPVALRKTTGHLFCGVYARVVDGGEISPGMAVRDAGAAAANPARDVPANAPEPRQWPRALTIVDVTDGAVTATTETPNWPLPAAPTGSRFRIHPFAGKNRHGTVSAAIDATGERLTFAAAAALADATPGQRLLVTGPLG